MPTVLYNNLAKRLAHLRTRLLPSFSPIGTYSDPEYDLVRGYLLLCHAEIEAYFEDHCVRTVEQSLERWAREGRVNRCLAALLLHHDKEATSGTKTMTAHLNTAAKSHIGHVRNSNHGIKEKNVFGMYVPIGVDKAEVSTTLLAELDALGASRGSVAHTSARGVITPPDPKSTRDQIERVLAELALFDDMARTLPRR